MRVFDNCVNFFDRILVVRYIAVPLHNRFYLTIFLT